jgi:hypothetical protein
MSIALVRGAMRGDLDHARELHEQITRAGEAAAKQAGDIGHHVLLGTGDFGPKDEFLAIDEWTSQDTPRAFYLDPQFRDGFAQLFAAPVAPELYARRDDWRHWGTLAPAPGGQTYWYVIVKGHLAKPSTAENRATHDAIAAAFEKRAAAAGDIAHVPHLAVDDPRTFVNVDVTTNLPAQLALMSDPEFQSGFAHLFDTPPDVRIYRSTDWNQW